MGDVGSDYRHIRECDFTAHCIQRIETLKRDDSVQVEFVFAVDQNKENNVSYIVGEDRSDNVYYFGKVIGNILNGKD